MSRMVDAVQRSWDKLEPDQLKLYAKELAELYSNEQKILLELEEKNEVLERRIRDLETLLEIDKVLVKALSEPELVRGICRTIVDVEGSRLAVVSLADRSDEKVTLLGSQTRYPESEITDWADAAYVKSPINVAVATSNAYIVQNISTDLASASWRTEAIEQGYGSVIAIPLIAEHKVNGVLVVYSEGYDSFDNGKIKLLTQVAGALSFGITTLRAREARNTLEKKMIEYEELDKLKTNLLSTVSHELRTPLATIKGYVTLLLDYDRRLKRDEKLEYLNSVVNATDRLTELVDHLLDMSRLEAGLLRLQKQTISISKLIKQAVAEARLREPKYEFVIEIQPGIPKVNIDARRIRQVIDNILDNAVKYSSEKTRITVKAMIADSELLISTTDHGIGIPARDLERVFDRMYRVEQRSTAGIPGAGLGLAICKGFVVAHGGRIWVNSEEGKGSSFHFILPVHPTVR